MLRCSMAMDGRIFSILSTRGAVEHVHELPRVGAESLHVAALALGMKGPRRRATICPSRSSRVTTINCPRGRSRSETLEVVFAARRAGGWRKVGQGLWTGRT